MPRANRVTPFGDFEAVSARGLLHGNRGDLHRPDGTISKRRWAGKAWIACSLERPGGGRAIFDTRGHYTPLFFLDEATALAAGHRPCAFCRRADYKRFRVAWQDAGLGTLKAVEIDATLHAARLDGRARRLHDADPARLPVGTMLTADGVTAWLKTGQGLRPWSQSGYGALADTRAAGPLRVLTSAPLVAVLAAGYAPLLHHTAF